MLPNRHSAATAKVLSSFGTGAGASMVDLSHSIYREDQTDVASSYIISSQATGSRTIVNHNDLAEMTVDEFVEIAKAFQDVDTWWHFEVR